MTSEQLENKKFLERNFKLNEYQIADIFHNERQIGRTWSSFMKILLIAKSTKGNIIVDTDIMKNYLYREFPDKMTVSMNTLVNTVKEFSQIY